MFGGPRVRSHLPGFRLGEVGRGLMWGEKGKLRVTMVRMESRFPATPPHKTDCESPRKEGLCQQLKGDLEEIEAHTCHFRAQEIAVAAGSPSSSSPCPDPARHAGWAA